MRSRSRLFLAATLAILVACSADVSDPEPSEGPAVEQPVAPASVATTPMGAPATSTGDDELDEVVDELDRLEAELAELDVLDELLTGPLGD